MKKFNSVNAERPPSDREVDGMDLWLSFCEDGNVDVEQVAIQLIEKLGFEVQYLLLDHVNSTQATFSRSAILGFVAPQVWARIFEQLKAEGHPTESVEMAMARQLN